MKILLVEDEPTLGDTIRRYLNGEGFVCEWVQDAIGATDKILVYEYDCVLIDIMLPDGSGLDIVRTIKKSGIVTGIIIISAKNDLDDKLLGLDLGADDYLAKPFHLSELNSRIKALLRRRKFNGENEIMFNELTIIPAAQEVKILDNTIFLTRKEYDLLLYLLTNKNRVLTKSNIAEHLYGDEIDQADTFNFLYSHVKNLRKKMVDAGSVDYIQSVYGIGYKFAEK
ncbi:MAG: DNA-binding response OmpR family regulator [Spirosomataceae bacterium]|jgi:DNA-binding response OmpR family regulator